MNANGTQNYLLDANVFMEAHRRYYAFDLCPGFWECLLHHHRRRRQHVLSTAVTRICARLRAAVDSRMLPC